MAQKKDPAFMFYPQDFITGTMFFSHEDAGIYIRMLCAQHQMGGLIPVKDFDSIVPQDSPVRGKFIKTEDGYFNERLMIEIVKRQKKSQNLSANALKRWQQIECKSNAIALQKDMPIENENEDENVNGIVVENSVTVTSEKNKNQFPDMAAIQAMQLNDMEIERVEVYVGQKVLINTYWNSFSAKFDGTKFYQDRGAIISYFMNWLKGELAKGKKPGQTGRITVEEMRQIQEQRKKAI